MPSTETPRMMQIAQDLEDDGFYTAANSVRAIAEERDEYRNFYEAWVEAEVASVTGDTDLLRSKRQTLIATNRAIRNTLAALSPSEES
jgi:radical SAM superfamily enzyme YgiQ (UPF0313 family)